MTGCEWRNTLILQPLTTVLKPSAVHNDLRELFIAPNASSRVVLLLSSTASSAPSLISLLERLEDVERDSYHVDGCF